MRGSVEYCHVNRIFMCDQLCPGQSHYHQSLTPWSPGQHSDQPGFAGSGNIKYRKLEYKNMLKYSFVCISLTIFFFQIYLVQSITGEAFSRVDLTFLDEEYFLSQLNFVIFDGMPHLRSEIF